MGLAYFLEFFSQHNFVYEPVIVDILNIFTIEAITSARENFLKHRPTLPTIVLITPEDPSGTMYFFKNNLLK